MGDAMGSDFGDAMGKALTIYAVGIATVAVVVGLGLGYALSRVW